MPFKIYRIKQSSASIILFDNNKPVRVEFKGGSSRNNYHGQFATSDEKIQQLIESDKRFGDLQKGTIYLWENFADEPAVAGTVQTEPIEQPEKEVNAPAQTSPNANTVWDFKTTKAFLLEKGVEPDKLKNFPQVKAAAKEYGIIL